MSKMIIIYYAHVTESDRHKVNHSKLYQASLINTQAMQGRIKELRSLVKHFGWPTIVYDDILFSCGNQQQEHKWQLTADVLS